ncbi:MAG: hypothetical protein AAGN35_03195 [Bacteroidota bacterium]
MKTGAFIAVILALGVVTMGILAGRYRAQSQRFRDLYEKVRAQHAWVLGNFTPQLALIPVTEDRGPQDSLRINVIPFFRHRRDRVFTSEGSVPPGLFARIAERDEGYLRFVYARDSAVTANGAPTRFEVQFSADLTGLDGETVVLNRSVGLDFSSGKGRWDFSSRDIGD